MKRRFQKAIIVIADDDAHAAPGCRSRRYTEQPKSKGAFPLAALVAPAAVQIHQHTSVCSVPSVVPS